MYSLIIPKDDIVIHRIGVYTMASYNQMKSQGNNGGSGKYNQAGYTASTGKMNQGQFQKSGCGLFAVVAIIAIVAIFVILL